jgi:hypothetical protein
MNLSYTERFIIIVGIVSCLIILSIGTSYHIAHHEPVLNFNLQPKRL